MFGFVGPSSPKIIFILLIEAIAIHVQVFIIKVGELSFEELFARTRSGILLQQLNSTCITL